jgi:cytochrome P450
MQAATTTHMMDILQEEVVASLRNISLRARENRAFMPHNVIKTMPLNFMMRIYTSSRYEGEIFDDVDSYAKAIRETLASKNNNQRNMTGAALIYLAEEMMRLTFSPSLGAYYPFLWKLDPLCRDTDKCNETINEVVGMIIAEHRKWSEANPNAEPRDIVDSMLVEVDKGNLLECDIRGQIVDALAAGTDTVSSWLEQFVHHMADYPHILKKVQEEIDHAVGDRMVQPSDLQNLPYFWATLKEIERHASLSTYAIRSTCADFTFEKYQVAAGTVVGSSMDVFRFSPEHVKDPNNFNPDNFIDDPFLDLTGRKGGVTYAFGGGLRVCVGARLAEKELLLYGANLAHCFSWCSPTGEKISNFTMSGIVRHVISAPVLFTQRRHFEELEK